MGKYSRLFTAGWGQDRKKMGSSLIDRTKGESCAQTSRWDETERGRGTGLEFDRGKYPEIGRKYGRDNGRGYGREC